MRRLVIGGVGRRQYNIYLNHLNQGTYSPTNINGFHSHESAEVSDRKHDEFAYLYCWLTYVHLSCFAKEVLKSSCAMF
jgi:hypothetical protein